MLQRANPLRIIARARSGIRTWNAGQLVTFWGAGVTVLAFLAWRYAAVEQRMGRLEASWFADRSREQFDLTAAGKDAATAEAELRNWVLLPVGRNVCRAPLPA
jgi:hypothetical protein